MHLLSARYFELSRMSFQEDVIICVTVYLGRVAVKAAHAHSTQISVVSVVQNVYRTLVGLVY